MHANICYFEFNDIIKSISKLDSNFIIIKTTRSNMEILKRFKYYKCSNSIGPGFYDIYSLNIPTKNDILKLIKLSIEFVSLKKLRIN
ncbi:MAG: hypothetical protein G8D24_01805 [Buchnera aphidicola (Periphyllus lyropictus)]|nr:hypothetical protein [Buchnera aphidicola (Periphyllus lyropictus)]